MLAWVRFYLRPFAKVYRNARYGLHLLRKSLRRRADKVGASELSELSCLVVSPGGVATTEFMKYLSLYLNLNSSDDLDGLKHLPIPPGCLEKNSIRIIFISGERESIYRSLRRRGYLAQQAAKLGSPISLLLPHPLKKFAFFRAIAKQEALWRSCACQDRILFVSFDELFESSVKIAAFLGVRDPRFVANFPKRRKRLSA